MSRQRDFLNRQHYSEKLTVENQYVGSAEGIDRQGETRWQCLVEGAAADNSIQPQGKIKGQTNWQNIGSPLVGLIDAASTAVDVKNFDVIRFKAALISPLGQTNQKQTLTPSAPPTTGTYKIKIGSQTTAAIAAAATANQIRDAIRLLTGFQNIVVVGTLATTAVIEMIGVTSSQPLIEIVDNTLLATATPVVLTPTISTAFVQGSATPTFIASSFWD